MSQFIGVIYEAETKQVRLLVSPDVDAELNDTAWTDADGEKRLLLRVDRSRVSGAIDIPGIVAICQAIVEEEG